MHHELSNLPSYQRAPVLSLCAALILGIMIANIYHVPSSILMIISLVITPIMVCLLNLFPNKHFVFLPFLFLWVLVGMIRTDQAMPRTHPVLKQLLEQPTRLPMVITGKILTPPVYHPVPTTEELTPRPQSPRTTFDLKLLSIQGESNPGEISGKLRVSVVGEIPQLNTYSTIQLAGHLFAANLPTNPQDFNYRAYLQRHNIDGMFWSEHPHALTVLSPAKGNTLTQLKFNIRDYLTNLYTRQLGPNYSPLANSLVLGDRSELPRELEDSFFVTGLTHILAISGFHMGILWFLLNGLFYYLIRETKIRFFVALFFLWGFAWLVDTGPPVQRAVIMATFYVGGQYLLRPTSSLAIWGITLLLQLIYDPFALFDLGAQLSFLAVLIIIEYEPIQAIILKQVVSVDPLNNLPAQSANQLSIFLANQQKNITHQLFLSLAITICLAPLTILRFNLLSPYAGILTLMIFPFVAALLVLLFLFPLISLFPIVSSCSIMLIQLLVELINLIVLTGGNLPGAYIRLPPLPEWWAIGIYLILITYWFLLRAQPSIYWRLHVPFATIFVLTLCSGPLYSLSQDRQQHAHLQITALDVGHGGAILIQFPNRRLVLYDCGSISGPIRAQKAILAGLRDLGATKLDAIIISHSDLDHFNGISSLIESVRVDNIYFSPSFVDLRRRGLNTTINSVCKQGMNITPLQSGDQIVVDSQVEMKVLHPTANPEKWQEKDNENSLIIKMTFAGRSILLTGDIEGDASRQLTFNDTEPLDVLFAPHHGSKFANTPPFAIWSKPKIVLICQDDPLVTRRMQDIYQATADHVLCTGDGACRVTIAPSGNLQLSQFQPTNNSPIWKILQPY